MRSYLLLVIAFVAGAGVFHLFPQQPRLAAGLAILTFIATLWLTEAIHITATALLVPVAAAVMGLMSVKEAFSSFASPIIFLFLGGFALAAAMRQHSLDQWLALLVIRWSRGNLRIAVLLLFLVTAWTSMWISNTATTVMMLPIALGLLEKLDWDEHPGTFVFVLLGVAYSANIGGIGTLVGSPPNAIAASILGLDFASWMQIGIPMVMVLLPAILMLLWLMLRPRWPVSEELLTEELPHITVWTPQAKGVLLVFACVVTCWLLSKPLSQLLGIDKGFDALVAVLGAVVLLACKLLDWKQFEQDTEWGVLLLFGGGIALSGVLSLTGSSEYLAQQLVAIFAGMPAVLFLALAVGLMILLTEISSNTASAALFIPIFYSLPEAQIGLSPLLLSLSIAVAASCAFMLPVATPPNAIMFGTGLIQQRQMMRVGLVLNLVCIGLITTFMPLLAVDL
ncbi:MAG: SLC13 family permease [Candidatus Pelagadaptatus aseana]|uniref:SLC13 family permease n=1 Tax=Candidatus Pelagadaptatus aseana TaxID=3120508 RepID=UPI0039B27269